MVGIQGLNKYLGVIFTDTGIKTMYINFWERKRKI